MAKTKKERLTAALKARGYVARHNPLGSKYNEYVLGPGAQSLLKAGHEGHRILVGKNGALRHTTSVSTSPILRTLSLRACNTMKIEA